MPNTCQTLKALRCLCFDLFAPTSSHSAWRCRPQTSAGAVLLTHAMAAGAPAHHPTIDFALAHDDSASAARLASKTDVVLVRRVAQQQTPTCLYLAMRHGVRR